MNEPGDHQVPGMAASKSPRAGRLGARGLRTESRCRDDGDPPTCCR